MKKPTKKKAPMKPMTKAPKSPPGEAMGKGYKAPGKKSGRGC